MPKRIIYEQLCLFDTHPAFEGYECPFVKSQQVQLDCKEVGCPLFKEEARIIDIDDNFATVKKSQ